MVRVPSIYKDGTSKAALFGQYKTALEAVERAHERIKNTAPMMRDYMPQDDDAYYDALEEHRVRMELLSKVEAELKFIVGMLDYGKSTKTKNSST